MLDYIFNAKDLPTNTTDPKYSRGRECTEAALKIILVVDRMLLVIVVLFKTDIKRKEEKYWKVFKKMEI
jgi:hypothetical protein